MLVTYHLLCFSEAAYDKNFQKNLGYSLIVTEVLLIVASLLLICRQTIISMKKSLRRRKMRRALKKYFRRSIEINTVLNDAVVEID